MREKLKDYLTDLVNIPSVTGNERDIADYVENF